MEETCGMPSHTEVRAAVLRELLEFSPTTKHIREGFGQLIYGHSMLMQLSAWQIFGDSNVDGRKHRDHRPTEIKKSEREVKKTKDAINSFLNPFSIENKDELIVLSSGAAASSDISADVLAADTKGEQARDEFITSRLQTGQDFFAPVKRLNLQTLEDTSIVTKMKAAKSQVIRYKEQATIAFKLLVKTQSEGLQLNMKELMSYPLTKVPFSIGTGKSTLTKKMWQLYKLLNLIELKFPTNLFYMLWLW